MEVNKEPICLITSIVQNIFVCVPLIKQGCDFYVFIHISVLSYMMYNTNTSVKMSGNVVIFMYLYIFLYCLI